MGYSEHEQKHSQIFLPTSPYKNYSDPGENLNHDLLDEP